jgi:hypothetical protein
LFCSGPKRNCRTYELIGSQCPDLRTRVCRELQNSKHSFMQNIILSNLADYNSRRNRYHSLHFAINLGTLQGAHLVHQLPVPREIIKVQFIDVSISSRTIFHSSLTLRA